MIQYLRIPKTKFWAWVVSSLVVGILVGAVAAYVIIEGSHKQQISELQKQLQNQATQAASAASAIKSQLNSAEASLTALVAQNESLKSQSSASSQAQSSGTTQTVSVAVISRAVTPSTVATGDAITMTARVQGHPDRVTMRIYSSAVGYDETFVLKRVSHSGTTETWRSSTTAPKKTGTYHYYATATVGDKSVTKAGATPGALKVD